MTGFPRSTLPFVLTLGCVEDLSHTSGKHVMAPFSARTLLGLAAAGLVLRIAAPLVGCDSCSAGTSNGQDLLIGLAMLGALVWGAVWLEKAPLKSVAVNLTGLGVAGWFVWSFAGSLAG